MFPSVVLFVVLWFECLFVYLRGFICWCVSVYVCLEIDVHQLLAVPLIVCCCVCVLFVVVAVIVVFTWLPWLVVLCISLFACVFFACLVGWLFVCLFDV